MLRWTIHNRKTITEVVAAIHQRAGWVKDGESMAGRKALRHANGGVLPGGETGPRWVWQ